MIRQTTAILVLPLAAILILPGCDGGGSSGGGTGSLSIHLTDAPIDLTNVENVTVVLTGVIVYPADDSLGMGMGPAPLRLVTHPATFDLLTLTGGATALLASGEVPAGIYSRIRLEVSEATLTYRDGGGTVGLKLEPNKVDVPIRFEVVRDAGNNLTLDFDAAASVKVNETSSDQMILRPVVTPVY